MIFRTRFAPSPTGPLHLGHAFSALTAQARAEARGGEMLLRIEDIDTARARPHWEQAIHDDLAWLGLRYPVPVMRQSERGAAHAAALEALWSRGLLYPCRCTRRDIVAATTAPQEGDPPLGPDGIVYPGTCRRVPSGPMPAGVALRLNMKSALEQVDIPAFRETGRGPDGETGEIRVAPEAYLTGIGDVVLRRPPMAAAYHLAVVVDDAAQGVAEVVRGEDLFGATAIHVLLQALLGLQVPDYHHHRLIRDAQGKRLAKRDDARALATFRAEGRSPAEIRRMVGLSGTGDAAGVPRPGDSSRDT